MQKQAAQSIRFCTSRDGVRLAYATCGDGPVVVAAAHWISHLRHDWDNPVRCGWLTMLSRRHTLIRYDARGTGLSDRSGVQFSLERQIEDLEAIVEAAGLDRFALLGLWTGGAAAINYAVRHPNRVTHLLLHACATRGRLRSRSQPRANRGGRSAAQTHRAWMGERQFRLPTAPHVPIDAGRHW